MTYKCPIELKLEDARHDSYSLSAHGKNSEAIYCKKTHVFIVREDIILLHHDKTYRLHEYHFHVPSEHVTKHKYNAEIHYVFMLQKHNIPYDVCGGHIPHDEILVLAVFIQEYEDMTFDLPNVQVLVPTRYFEYDGTVVQKKPIRWIIGRLPIHSSISQLVPISKASHDLQSTDHRIILYASTI